MSTNNGNSWAAVTNGLTNNSGVWSLAISGNNIFAGGNGGVYLSTNNGNSWVNKLASQGVYSFAISGSNIFAGTWGSGVYLSTNNGNSWTAVSNGLPNNSGVWSLAINNSNIFAGTLHNASYLNLGGVFLSTNNGSSWTNIYSTINTDIEALAINNNNIFAGTSGIGIYLSSNNGNSWTAVNTGLTNTNILSLAINDSNIYAGTQGSGIWKRKLTDFILPANAGIITGPTTVCQGQNSIVYKVPPIAYATSYIWTLPNGVIDTTLTDSITINYGTSSISGNIKVKGNNSIGFGISSTLAITVNHLSVNIGNDSNIACGGNIILSPNINYTGVQSNLSYQWSPTYGLDSVNIKNPNVRPFTTTTYYLNLSSVEGCHANRFS